VRSSLELPAEVTVAHQFVNKRLLGPIAFKVEEEAHPESEEAE
jgi:hypothetical protein